MTTELRDPYADHTRSDFMISTEAERKLLHGFNMFQLPSINQEIIYRSDDLFPGCLNIA